MGPQQRFSRSLSWGSTLRFEKLRSFDCTQDRSAHRVNFEIFCSCRTDVLVVIICDAVLKRKGKLVRGSLFVVRGFRRRRAGVEVGKNR